GRGHRRGDPRRGAAARGRRAPLHPLRQPDPAGLRGLPRRRHRRHRHAPRGRRGAHGRRLGAAAGRAGGLPGQRRPRP
ncbi:MAG: Acetolactate synthase large subunit, partial [uncultured Thermomicrobiales bacterium]